mgnify:CR=1 FL=1
MIRRLATLFAAALASALLSAAPNAQTNPDEAADAPFAITVRGDELSALLEEVNAELPPWERMPQIFVTREEWGISNGLLTPTMKLKRQLVQTKYAPQIEAMYR